MGIEIRVRFLVGLLATGVCALYRDGWDRDPVFDGLTFLILVATLFFFALASKSPRQGHEPHRGQTTNHRGW